MEWFQLTAWMLAPSAQHPIGSSGDIYPTVTVIAKTDTRLPTQRGQNTVGKLLSVRLPVGKLDIVALTIYQ